MAQRLAPMAVMAVSSRVFWKMIAREGLSVPSCCRTDALRRAGGVPSRPAKRVAGGKDQPVKRLRENCRDWRSAPIIQAGRPRWLQAPARGWALIAGGDAGVNLGHQG